MKKLLIFSGIVFCSVVIVCLFVNSTKPAYDKHKDDFQKNYKIYAINLPESLTFANEPVPLKEDDVRERLDRELLINVYWQSQMLLNFKRAARYFPVIEPILKKNNIPDDFKYIALIESGLMNVISNSAAVGFWQFLESTGKKYGLEVNEVVDERYNVEKSTEAICKYFSDAHRYFGNWTLAAASFNMGVYGIKSQLDMQKVNSYYDLYLNPETSRYIFRLLAVKEIIEHPQNYGFYYLDYHLYKPCKTLTVSTDSSIKDLVDFAFKHNTTYKELKALNPWLRKSYLSNKSRKKYDIQLPACIGKDETIVTMDNFVKPYESKYFSSFIPEDSLIIHTVGKDESIFQIEKKYQVRIPQIMQWNEFEGYFLKQGDQVKIYLKRGERKQN